MHFDILFDHIDTEEHPDRQHILDLSYVRLGSGL